MRSEETEIQKAVVRYLRREHPDILFTSVPTWGQGVKQGAKNKAMGLCKGWPDLFIAEPCKNWYGLFVEIKTEKGRPTKVQQEIGARLREKGYKAIICYGYEMTIEKLDRYILGDK
jgi:hypothetical protein